MMRKLIIIPFILFFLILGTLQCMANVPCIVLDVLIMRSDYIVLGEVTNIIAIKGNEYADISILKTLKSKSKVEGLYYVFQTNNSFACDISGATKGETYLFFMKVLKLKHNNKRLKTSYSLLEDTWSGRGTMPIKAKNNRKYVRVFDVFLPKQLKNKSIQSSSWKCLTPLDDMLKYVTAVVNGGPGDDY